MPDNKQIDITDIHTDAVFLHGLTQGVGILYDEAQSPNDVRQASNAAHALIVEIITKADKLSQDIEAYETANRSRLREVK